MANTRHLQCRVLGSKPSRSTIINKWFIILTYGREAGVGSRPSPIGDIAQFESGHVHHSSLTCCDQNWNIAQLVRAPA